MSSRCPARLTEQVTCRGPSRWKEGHCSIQVAPCWVPEGREQSWATRPRVFCKQRQSLPGYRQGGFNHPSASAAHERGWTKPQLTFYLQTHFHLILRQPWQICHHFLTLRMREWDSRSKQRCPAHCVESREAPRLRLLHPSTQHSPLRGGPRAHPGRRTISSPLELASELTLEDTESFSGPLCSIFFLRHSDY